MADDKETKSSLGERQEDHELIPDAAPNPIEDLNPANDAAPISVFQVAPAARQIFDRRSLFARRCGAYMRPWRDRFRINFDIFL